jgi:hypothetical protein
MTLVSAPGVDAEDGPSVYIGNIPAWVAVPQFGQVGHYGWYQYPVLEPVFYSKSELEYRAKKKELDSARCAYEKSRLSLSVKDRQKLDGYQPWDGILFQSLLPSRLRLPYLGVAIVLLLPHPNVQGTGSK